MWSGAGPDELHFLILSGSAEQADDPGFAVVAGFERGDEHLFGRHIEGWLGGRGAGGFGHDERLRDAGQSL